MLRNVRNGRRYALCRVTLWLRGALQGFYSGLDHLAKSRGIVAQHALSKLRTRSAELLRRIPCCAKISVVDFLEHPRAFRRGARLAGPARIQFFQRARF